MPTKISEMLFAKKRRCNLASMSAAQLADELLIAEKLRHAQVVDLIALDEHYSKAVARVLERPEHEDAPG